MLRQRTIGKGRRMSDGAISHQVLDGGGAQLLKSRVDGGTSGGGGGGGSGGGGDGGTSASASASASASDRPTAMDGGCPSRRASSSAAAAAVAASSVFVSCCGTRGRRRRCVEQLKRDLENGRRQRRGHYGRELRQCGRACRLAAALFGCRARGQSVVITASVESRLLVRFFFPRGTAAPFASPLLFAQLCSARALWRSLAVSCATTPPTHARSLTTSAAAAAPPFRRRRHPPRH